MKTTCYRVPGSMPDTSGLISLPPAAHCAKVRVQNSICGTCCARHMLHVDQSRKQPTALPAHTVPPSRNRQLNAEHTALCGSSSIAQATRININSGLRFPLSPLKFPLLLVGWLSSASAPDGYFRGPFVGQDPIVRT